MVPAFGSHTGRVTPRVTLKVTSLAVPESASIRSTPRSRAARSQCGAGVAWFADRFQIEPRDRITPGDDAIVRPARLRDQYVFVARGLGLDDVARRGRADFLVRREQYRDRQRRREGGARQLPDRFQREVVAALHVEDAGAETFIAFAPPLEFFQRADGVHG